MSSSERCAFREGPRRVEQGSERDRRGLWKGRSEGRLQFALALDPLVLGEGVDLAAATGRCRGRVRDVSWTCPGQECGPPSGGGKVRPVGGAGKAVCWARGAGGGRRCGGGGGGRNALCTRTSKTMLGLIRYAVPIVAWRREAGGLATAEHKGWPTLRRPLPAAARAPLRGRPAHR